MTDTGRAPRHRSLVQLVQDVPTLVKQLVHDEIALAKAELLGKVKSLGIGAGLMAAALVVLLYLVGVLLTAAVLALSLVLPGWASALIVAGVLLIVAAVLALVGFRILKRGLPPVPTETIDSLKADLRAVKGLGDKGRTKNS